MIHLKKDGGQILFCLSGSVLKFQFVFREKNTFFYENERKDFRNWYCYHVYVIAYPQSYGER